MAGFPMELSPNSSTDDTNTNKDEDVNTFTIDHKSGKYLPSTQSTSMSAVRTILQITIKFVYAYYLCNIKTFF